MTQNFFITYTYPFTNGFPNYYYILNNQSIDIHSIEQYQECAILIPYDYKNIIEPKCFTSSPDYTYPIILPIQSKQKIHNIHHLSQIIHTLFPFSKHNLSQSQYDYNYVSYEAYEKNFYTIQTYLKNGDIYEINYCIPFIYQNIDLSPGHLFLDIISHTPTPFSALFKFNDWYILSFSPERFLKKENNYLFTEPIKGTAPRSNDPVLDQMFKQNLQNDIKEKTENLMIVDVCRNDLSRIAQKNSVKVEALCSIKTYPTVHQMISKVSCKLKDNLSFKNIIDATFPMASMTGAPKIRAMQIAEELEKIPRQFYSGCIGIYTAKNFDLSVLIRSIFYNETKKELIVWAGSAITLYTQPQKEYNECLFKVKKILQIIENHIPIVKSMT